MVLTAPLAPVKKWNAKGEPIVEALKKRVEKLGGEVFFEDLVSDET